MIDEEQNGDSAARTWKRARGRIRLRLLLLVVLLLILFLVIPPWISIGRYKSSIAQVLSSSVGRPVQISSVELRLLPWPGFLISDLSIAEDPAYGAEPVLHANTVRASIRLLSLWRGRLEIGAIHVDEASLNIVHVGQGRWNLDPLFRSAASHAGKPGSADTAFRWPSLDATNSRINVKNGAEKLPFSLVNTDLTFWQENSDEWRIRLRGQPARTDVALEQGDTGTLRIEARMKHAPAMSQMPLLLDLDWREAQLGQLSKLLTGSDPGWRGDLTGNLHLEGTPSAAQITMQLTATGVHRAEFAPRTSLDFDAKCAFLFRYLPRSIENLSCDSPLGDGRMRMTGSRPADQPAHFTAELDKIPVAAGLDVLRTLRSGLAPDLEAVGTVTGRIDYAGRSPDGTLPPKPAKSRVAQRRPSERGPLSGSLTVDGFELSGGALTQPMRVPKITLEAVEAGEVAALPFPAIEGTAALNAGGPGPLSVSARFTASGYEMTFRGPATISRARELAQTAGWSQTAALTDLAGDPLALNLTAAGPWLTEEAIAPGGAAAVAQAHAVAAVTAALGVPQRRLTNDDVTGTVILRNANWKADYLASHVEIAAATLHLEPDDLRWDVAEFTYGPLKGAATITISPRCAEELSTQLQATCVPQFQLQFGQLDASEMEVALLGAREKGTLLSSLIDRLHPASTPLWPAFSGTMSADTFVLGPVKLEKVSASVTFAADHAEFSGLLGNLLGGQVLANGTVRWPGSDQKQPSYAIEGHGDGLNPAAVGQLLGQRWSGGQITVGGKFELAGFTDSDLGASAKGKLHFDWSGGTMPVGAAARFDHWSGDALIEKGAVTLNQNEVVAGHRKQAFEGVVTFGTPPKVRFVTAKSR